MRAAQLVTLLADAVGKERVVLRTEYHVQVLTAAGVQANPHDIWLNRFGHLKWKLSGSRGVTQGNPARLLQNIQGHSAANCDLAAMQTALDLGRSINAASAAAARLKVTRAVFVDAGFKNGGARISVVAILGNDVVEAFAQPVEASGINDAESQAVRLAKVKYPDPALPIYSDSQHAVAHANDPERVKWIPREQNKPADRIANLRDRK